jgi:phage tail protein X
MPEEKPRAGRVIHVFSNILSEQAQRQELPPEVPSRRWMYWQMTMAVTRKVIRAPYSLHTWGALRRHLLAIVLPDNLLYRYKAYQRGECNRCGLCCKIQFQCPFFVDEGPFNTRCSIYTTPYVPSACAKFPMDPMDLKLLQREVGNACTFYYEGAPQKLSILDFAKLYTEGIRQQLAKRKLKEAADSGN